MARDKSIGSVVGQALTRARNGVRRALNGRETREERIARLKARRLKAEQEAQRADEEGR